MDICEIEGLDSKLITESLKVNRILGCIYGNALGDAYGLATEFSVKKAVARIYPDPKELIPFPNFQPTGHSSSWKKGDWTDDTDQMILILETLLETGGQIDEIRFAKKLRTWVKQGFPELGDMSGMGCGGTVGSSVRNPEFLENPSKAAHDTWIRWNKNAAANGAAMRTSILGCFKFEDLEAVKLNTKRFCQTTHWDSRCVASCIAMTVMISFLIQAENEFNLEELIQRALGIAEQELDENYLEEFRFHMNQTDVTELKLDEQAKIGYTLKCVGSAFWGLRNGTQWDRTLNTLIREAGDADTNGAACGSVVGCYVGYTQLPQQWLAAMPNKKWLDKKVVDFLKLSALL